MENKGKSVENGQKSSPKSRIVEIDVLRGIAILLMSSFHLVFDLMAYFGKGINIYSGFWFYVGRSSAILFMLVSGISSTFGGKQIRRGFIVLGAALLITLASIPTMGENYIRFGILHYFAAVMLLKGIFDSLVKNYWARLATAALLIPVCYFMGELTKTIAVNTFWLLPLGFTYPTFTSFDYYPLFPWAGWFCGGIALGLTVYKSKRSLFSFANPAPEGSLLKRGIGIFTRPLSFLGRHSLLMYLLHQPLILGVLFLLHFMEIL